MNETVVAAIAAAMAGPVVLILAHVTSTLRYAPGPPEVAAVTAMAGTTTALVLSRPITEVAVLLPIAVLGGAAAVVDAHEGRLPDTLTIPLLAVSLLGVVMAGRSLVGVVVAVGLLLVFKTAASAAMGWGDVKLVPSLVAVLVTQDALVDGVILMVLLVGASALLIGLHPRHGTALVPYGPALLLGTLGAAAVGV